MLPSRFLPDIVNRVAIVTGATSCVGAATATKLLTLGMKVVCVARNVAGLQDRIDVQHKAAGRTGAPLVKAYAAQGDVSNPEDVKRIVRWTGETLGGVDVLVNGAGSFYRSKILSSDPEKMKNMINANILGTILFSREVALDMIKRKKENGHIVTISSIIGEPNTIVPDLDLGVYISLTQSVMVISRNLMFEVQDLGLAINVANISSDPVLCRKKDSPCKDIFVQTISEEDVVDAICCSITNPLSYNHEE